MIYLASPYSHEDPRVMRARYEAVSECVAKLIRAGYLVFSPIAYSHPLAESYKDLGFGFESWREFDIGMLSRATTLAVLQLDGWSESQGIEAEIDHAEKIGLPIAFTTVEEINEL